MIIRSKIVGRYVFWLKDGIKGVMVVDSIRFIGGENKVYVYKIFLKKVVNYKLLIV